MNPTKRSIAHARKMGWLADVCERWLPYHGGRVSAVIRKDMFGVFDLVVVRGGLAPHLAGVQVTSGANHAARIAKILAWPGLELWLASGAKAEVWSWRKGGPAGKRKLWQVRIEEVTRATSQAEVGA